jgi:hypothetical protein
VLDGMLEFIGFEFGFGTHRAIGQPAGGFEFVILVVGRFERDGGPAFLTAEFVVAGVGDGAEQPGFEGAAAVAVQAAKSGDEGFLGGIGGLGIVAENAQGGVVERILVGQHEPVEGLEVTMLRVVDQGGFIHADIVPVFGRLLGWVKGGRAIIF